MKIQLDINQNQFYDEVRKVVREFMDREALLRFIREEIIRISKSAKRKQISEMIRHLEQRITLLEKRHLKKVKRIKEKNEKLNRKSEKVIRKAKRVFRI